MASISGLSEGGWSKFVERTSKLVPRKQRAIACIVGALIADAAAQPLHWIYDVGKLKEILNGVSEPEFMTPPHCPFYQVGTGSHTPCGDEALVQLISLAECKGLNLENAKAAFMKKYGPGSEIFEAARIREETGDKTLPIKGLWTNHPVKDFVKAVMADASSTAGDTNDPDCIARCLPLAAFYAGDPNLLKTATDCAHLMQKLDLAVASARVFSRIVERFVLTDDTSLPVEKVLQGVVQELENPKRDFPHDLDGELAGQIKEMVAMDKTMDNAVATKQIGSACGLPASFKSAIYILLQKGDSGFVDAARNVITSGGDSSSRVNMVGACVGAKYGLSSIPTAWALKTRSIGAVVQSVEKLFFF
jgi:ADP-ribosylglycohydrolase